jgi:hypothetical protein
MNENTNPEPPPAPDKEKNPLVTILWLLLAFVPSMIAAPFVSGRNGSQFPMFLFFLAIACCAFSAFGVLRSVKDVVLRVFLGLGLAVVFFVLNAFIVILVGCSHMGPI